MITLLLLWLWLNKITLRAIHDMDLTIEEKEEIEDKAFMDSIEPLVEYFNEIKKEEYEEELAEIEREEYRKIDKIRKQRVIQHDETLEYTCCSRWGKHPAHGTKRRDLAIAYKEARALKNKFLYENM